MSNTLIDMQPIEWYLEHADELAQKVVNAWGSNVSFTDDLKALFDKAYRYLEAKREAGDRRQSGTLSEADAAEEKTARQTFAEAYKGF